MQLGSKLMQAILAYKILFHIQPSKHSHMTFPDAHKVKVYSGICHFTVKKKCEKSHGL